MPLLAAVLSLPATLTVAVSLLAAFAFRSRLHFAKLRGVFRCKLAPGHQSFRRAGAGRWPKRAVFAVWAHDVLLVRLGRLPATVHVFPGEVS